MDVQIDELAAFVLHGCGVVEVGVKVVMCIDGKGSLLISLHVVVELREVQKSGGSAVRLRKLLASLYEPEADNGLHYGDMNINEEHV